MSTVAVLEKISNAQQEYELAKQRLRDAKKKVEKERAVQKKLGSSRWRVRQLMKHVEGLEKPVRVELYRSVLDLLERGGIIKTLVDKHGFSFKEVPAKAEPPKASVETAKEEED